MANFPSATFTSTTAPPADHICPRAHPAIGFIIVARMMDPCSMDFERIVTQFGNLGSLPKKEILYALDHPDEVVPGFLEILESEANGVMVSDEQYDALFLALHILAEHREHRAYRPLVQWLRGDSLEIEDYLGDATTETLPRVLISLCDGDFQPLIELAEDEYVDEFVREAGMTAWAHFALVGDISEDDARQQLQTWFKDLKPVRDSHIWSSWMDAVAVLQFRDMIHMVEQVLKEERPPMWAENMEEFMEFFEEVPTLPRDELMATERMEPFYDTAGVFEDWYRYSPEYLKDVEREPAWQPSQMVTETVTNPVRHVGRNDLCPCGSGKKFKKCCLH